MGVVVGGAGVLVSVVAVAVGVVVVGAPVLVVGAVVGVVGAVVPGAVDVLAGGAAPVVADVVVVIVVGVLVDVPEVTPVPSPPPVSSSATRIPTRTARTAAAISATSGPRRRWRVVPQLGQKRASVATGVPQTTHGPTETGAPPEGGTGVDIAPDATCAPRRASRRRRRQAAVGLVAQLPPYRGVDVVDPAVDLALDAHDPAVHLGLDRRARARERVRIRRGGHTLTVASDPTVVPASDLAGGRSR